MQKHAARRLHYDLRLEIGDALASWAVTRGPSLVPGEKRLAVHVEDHPLDYADFEGQIPKGQYGGGEVIVWDRGRWEPEGDPARGLRKGRLDFTLEGAKLKGRWHLVRMGAKRGEKRENWLLIKGSDAEARGEADPDILEEAPESVISGRTIEDIAAGRPAPRKPAAARRRSRRRPAAALPRLRSSGARDAEAEGAAGRRLAPRDQVRRLPAAGADPRRQGEAADPQRAGLDRPLRERDRRRAGRAALPTAILDGELVVEGAGGASDFSALQADLSAGRTDRFRYYLFDLLYLDGEDLRAAPLVDRKARLAALLQGAPDPLRLSEHFDEDGEVMLRHACRLSLEGLVSKRRDAAYPAGRSRILDQVEMLRPAGIRHRRLRAVLGFQGARRLAGARISRGRRARPCRPGRDRLQPRRGARTSSPGSSRYAARPRPFPRSSAPTLRAASSGSGRSWWPRSSSAPGPPMASCATPPSAACARTSPRARSSARRRVETAPAPKPQVRLTHPDRIYWPDAGVTKQGLADYYAEVWPRMAPFIVNRPVALLRCPAARGPVLFPEARVEGSEPRDPDLPRPARRDEAAACRRRWLARPDRPGAGRGARDPHLAVDPRRPRASRSDRHGPRSRGGSALDRSDRRGPRLCARVSPRGGLVGFVKTSGGKGLHVVAPLKPADGAGWDEVKGFAAAMARSMAEAEPGSLRRDDQQGEATRKNPARLPAQRAQQHGDRRLRHPRPRRRPGFDAARLGRARA